MAWKDQYQQGEFRGVPFFMQSHSYSSGRDVVGHKFPGRDDRYNEDTGRSEPVFRVSLYLAGDDYFEWRERLISALEEKGPGRLVHPYRGIFSVVVQNFSVSESTEDGGMASFDVTFVQDVETSLTITQRSTSRGVTTARTNLYSAIQDDFVSKYPSRFVVPSVLKTVQGAIEKTTAAVDKAKTAVYSVAEYRKQVERIQGKIIEFSLNALDLAKEIRALVDWGADPFGNVIKPTVENSRQIIKDMGGVITSMTQPWDIAASMSGGITAELVRKYNAACAVASTVGVVATIPVESVAEADEVQTSVFTMLDMLQNDPDVSQEVFDTVADAKKAVSEDLSRRILSISAVIDYRTPECEPTLAISQEVYGNVSRVDEIISRNKIRHPGFSPAAVPLKIQVPE